MNFKTAMDIILDLEGGSKIVDDQRDPGGLTKWGISIRANPELSEDQLRKLTKAQAIEIYKEKYWNPSFAAKMPSIMKLPLFDAAVNHGVKGSALILQRALNVMGSNLAVDGIIGPKTLEAVKSVDPQELAVIFLQERLNSYRATGNYETFGKGWERRILKVGLLAKS